MKGDQVSQGRKGFVCNICITWPVRGGVQIRERGAYRNKDIAAVCVDHIQRVPHAQRVQDAAPHIR